LTLIQASVLASNLGAGEGTGQLFITCAKILWLINTMTHDFPAAVYTHSASDFVTAAKKIPYYTPT